MAERKRRKTEKEKSKKGGEVRRRSGDCQLVWRKRSREKGQG
jgi:hypothetical protein